MAVDLKRTNINIAILITGRWCKDDEDKTGYTSVLTYSQNYAL